MAWEEDLPLWGRGSRGSVTDMRSTQTRVFHGTWGFPSKTEPQPCPSPRFSALPSHCPGLQHQRGCRGERHSGHHDGL